MTKLIKDPSSLFESILEADIVSKDIVRVLRNKLPQEIITKTKFDQTQGSKSPVLTFRTNKVGFVAYFKPKKNGELLSANSPVKLDITIQFYHRNNPGVEIKEFSAPRPKVYSSKEEAISAFLTWVNKNIKKVNVAGLLQ